MVDFALIELFRYLLWFRSYEAKCVPLGCFRWGSASLHLNLPSQGRTPSTVFGIRTLGYPMKTASLCVPS